MAICGILTASVIVLSQIYCFHEACNNGDSIEKTADKTENKKAEGHQAYFTMPSSPVPSPVTIQLDQEIVFICDVSIHKEEDNSCPSLIFISLDKFFKTLLRVIISPNAP